MHLFALDDNFFRSQFKAGRGDARNFASLKDLVVSGGSVAYHTLFEVGIICSLIALMLAGVTLALASKSKGYDETKKRLTRVLIVLVFLTSLVGLVGQIAKFFSF